MNTTLLQIWNEIYDKTLVENQFLFDLIDDWKISKSCSIEELIQSRIDYAEWLKKMIGINEDLKTERFDGES